MVAGLRDVKLHLIETLDDILAYKEWLGQRRPHNAIAVDTETTGLIVGKDVVRVVSVGDGRHGWVMPWSNERGAEGRFIGGYAGLFADTVKTWAGWLLMHNAPFDYGMLDHMGVPLEKLRIVDTRVMAHIDSPHLSTALKNVADRFIDGASSQAQAKLQVGTWTWATVPIDYRPYWVYAALDPVLTYLVYDYLKDRVLNDAPTAFELENSVQWVTQRMSRYGVHIDVPFARDKFKAFTDYVDELGRWIESEYRVKPGSNASIVRVLQDAGFQFAKATASGAVALDKNVLAGIEHPLAHAVLARRQIQKLANTYLKHFVEEVDSDDLLHPTVNTLGARTSRMSMSDPNFQNLPRANAIELDLPATAVRRCVRARDGNVLLMCDFDQVEMRILAHMANEQSMIAAFKDTSQDFFVTLARLIYADDTIVKSDPRRQVTKNAGYATIFGAGLVKFGVTAGISTEQASWVRRKWDDLFPNVARFQRQVIDVATKRRAEEGQSYVRCPITGRRQVGDPGKEYALVNFLIQGAAAAIFKRKLLELDAAGLGDWMMLPVHDEVILDVPREHAAHAARTLYEIMNDDQILSVPLTASVSHGPTWADKEAWTWES